jgi:hypothetical protein
MPLPTRRLNVPFSYRHLKLPRRRVRLGIALSVGHAKLRVGLAKLRANLIALMRRTKNVVEERPG